MKHNFDEMINRRGSNCFKWDFPDDPEVLPMWVADMDFKAAPAIREALRRRIDEGVFGYTKVPQAYYDAVVSWFERRHGWTIAPDRILYTTGVVPAVAAILAALTEPGDRVIMQIPAYNCFFRCIADAKLTVAENRLVRDSLTGRYSIDLAELERLASDPRAKVLLLCNPHNPTGHLWNPDELRSIAKICASHGVTIIADEIHCEFTYHDHEYTPIAHIAEEAGARYIVCNSSSKAFNIAGLQIANIIVEDQSTRELIEQALYLHEVHDVNPLGIVALMAAYNDSADWLDEMLEYIWGNYELVRDFMAEHLPDYRVTPLESTYLAWINIEPSGLKSQEFADRMTSEAKLMVSPGCIYGDDNFIRLNMACPRERVLDGLQRLEKFCKSL